MLLSYRVLVDFIFAPSSSFTTRRRLNYGKSNHFTYNLTTYDKMVTIIVLYGSIALLQLLKFIKNNESSGSRLVVIPDLHTMMFRFLETHKLVR